MNPANQHEHDESRDSFKEFRDRFATAVVDTPANVPPLKSTGICGNKLGSSQAARPQNARRMRLSEEKS